MSLTEPARFSLASQVAADVQGASAFSHPDRPANNTHASCGQAEGLGEACHIK